MPFEMPDTNVGSNIRRTEQDQTMIDAQAQKGTASTQCQVSQTYHPLQTPLLHEARSQRAGPMPNATRERGGTLVGDAGSLIASEIIQENDTSSLDGRDLFVELEVGGAPSGERAIIDQESTGAPNPDQRLYRDSRTCLLDPGYREPKGQTELSSHHISSDCPSANIKIEQTTPTRVNVDIVPRDKAYADMSRPVIRISSPVAERFYRSATVKVEEDEAARSNMDKPLRSNRELSIPTNSPKGIPRKPVPIQQPIKEEVEERTYQSYYIPTGAASANTSFAPRALHTSCPTTNRQNLRHSYISYQYEAEHVVQASSAPPNRHTATASPSPPRPDTKLSYLRALTPTPFSTPYGMVNHHPYEAHLHFIPGAMLEGMLRRTRWGSAVPRPASRREVEAEQGHEREQEEGVESEGGSRILEEGNTRPGVELDVGGVQMTVAPDPRRKTCVWYKLLFCTCCKWSMITVPIPRESVVVVARESSRRLVHDAPAPAPVPEPASGPTQWNRRGAETETKVKWWRRLRGRKKGRNEEATTRLAKNKGEGRGVVVRDALPVIRREEVRDV